MAAELAAELTVQCPVQSHGHITEPGEVLIALLGPWWGFQESLNFIWSSVVHELFSESRLIAVIRVSEGFLITTMFKMLFCIQEKGGEFLNIGLMNSKLCFAFFFFPQLMLWKDHLGNHCSIIDKRKKFEISSMFTKNGHINYFMVILP